MVALSSERQIFMWNLWPHAVPADAPVTVTVPRIVELLQNEFQAGKAFLYIDEDNRVVGENEAKNPKNCIFVADIVDLPHLDAWAILVTRGDPDAAHPSFINPIKLTVKDVKPADDEVQGWSAHMLISKTAHTQGRHRACFEKMPGVSSTLVNAFFERLIDNATADDPDLLYDRPLKRGKKIEVVERRCKYRLGINKVPAQTLKKDIEQGVLSQITLIREVETYGGPGDPSRFTTIKEELVIRTKKEGASKAYDLAQQIAKWGKEQSYQEVQFRIDKLPGNTSSSPRFELEKADAMDTLYSRSKRLLGFTSTLATCYSKVFQEICTMMAKELTDKSNWS
ncbi:hypothetical protein NRB_26460 [Novosphingobium sp. 11B]